MDRSGIDRGDYPNQLRQAISKYLPARGVPLMAKGQARWSDRLLVMVMLLMAWSGLGTLQDRFAEARAAGVSMYKSRRRPGVSYRGFINQLRRHSQRLLERVTGGLRQQVLACAGAHWKVGGFVAFGVDGTKSDAPRTHANREGLKIGGKRKSGPQQLLVTLMHVGTGLPWSWRRGAATASERGLLLEQLGTLPEGSLLLMDAGFTGYECLKTILKAGHQVLVRAGANVVLLEKLGWVVEEKLGLLYLWPARAQETGATPLVLRRIEVIDGRNRRMCLLTSLLQEEELSDEAAVELYKRRWGIEVLYRGLKQTLGRRKMLSDTPENAGVELDWTMVGYWMLGLLLWEYRATKQAVNCGMAAALRLVRGAMAGRGDRRLNFQACWKNMKVDAYHRAGPKASPDWPHKKNDHPCGIPRMRMATPAEVRRAKGLMSVPMAA